jgi:uncharacterized Tic20 family protein
MKLTFSPKSFLGKWAFRLAIAFIVLIGLKIMGVMPLMTFVIASIGVLGFVFALIAVYKNKDTSVLNLFAILVGLIIIAWTIAEIAMPH